ncbi:hypothetical protein OUZ56_008551 [Daphnia magna]|uniref:Uncharacterized protein n=1 Tax=Daphnia magna TaxID=35525 RepID=A0ABR0AAS8_9CRUS|nr:hypothetical protein OUZ56_007705 [Daphnia magna]KAK4023120.1 hypothetical protein OUZ56_008551 [Daphnia magna]
MDNPHRRAIVKSVECRLIRPISGPYYRVDRYPRINRFRSGRASCGVCSKIRRVDARSSQNRFDPSAHRVSRNRFVRRDERNKQAAFSIAANSDTLISVANAKSVTNLPPNAFSARCLFSPSDAILVTNGCSPIANPSIGPNDLPEACKSVQYCKMSAKVADKGSVPLPTHQFVQFRHAESYAASVPGWLPAMRRLTTDDEKPRSRNCRLTISRRPGAMHSSLTRGVAPGALM